MFPVRFALLLTSCILIPAVLSDISTTDFDEGVLKLFLRPTTNEKSWGQEDMNFINSDKNGNRLDQGLDIDYMKLMDEYGQHVNPGLNALRNQEMYKVLKRNGNIINTLLGVPRRLIMAGR